MKKILWALFAVAIILTIDIFNKVPPKTGTTAISATRLAQNIKILASDKFEGRAPGTPGEVKTINFLKQQFQKLGLKPGNGDSYFQGVKMVGITASPDAVMKITVGNAVTSLKYGPQFMAWTERVRDRVSVADSPMVFVGYGIVAPEYNWNDYKGLDVRGKTVVVMVNDPGFATKNPKLFTGNAMTYYGRWTYKYEEAARQGAAAVIIIHETKPAAYPWAVVQGSWTGPQFSLESADGNMSQVKVESWIPGKIMAKIFAAAGLDYAKLTAQAATRDFKAVPLKATMSVALKNTIRHVVSNNVVAVMPGTDEADQYIIYMAHWDHLGRNRALKGDQIYNGAADNASGVAGLIELANAFLTGREKPRRSIMFLSVTAEEQGLLGSEYYARHPLVPLDKTVAAINMDTLNTYGKTSDVTIVGYGNSELDDYVNAAARMQKRTVNPDPEPEKGSFYRSDHFSLAKHGVPALYFKSGVDNIKHGRKWMLAKIADYTTNRYHKPTDEYSANWNLSGAVEDLQLMYVVGLKLSEESSFPNWRKGNEFRAKRDAMMKK
ncbi:MAG: M28 family peptidase [Alphaproteobacteria bacterium]|nr:M28 family peptidase [Alphaproteobacteria bacterium]